MLNKQCQGQKWSDIRPRSGGLTQDIEGLIGPIRMLHSQGCHRNL